MIGISKVSVVEEPHVSVVHDLVVLTSEELCEVLCGLEQVREPNHCGEVLLVALEELASQLYLTSILLMSGLYTEK
jgi:hypothetical protein